MEEPCVERGALRQDEQVRPFQRVSENQCERYVIEDEAVNSFKAWRILREQFSGERGEIRILSVDSRQVFR